MPARIDLTGRVIGRWKVLRLDRTRRGAGAYWVCRCGCGRKQSVNGASLRQTDPAHRSTQCRSCSQIGHTKTPLIYQPGDRAGLWTVLRHRSAEQKYVCRCDCGNVSFVTVGKLRAGKTSGCKACRSGHRSGVPATIAARVCRTCGGPFTGDARQKYCRPECRPSHWPTCAGG